MKKTLLIITLIFALPIIGYAILHGKQPVSSNVAIASPANMPQMIKFSAPMCSDCQVMNEVLNQVKPQYEGKVNFVEISVSEKSPQVSQMIKKYNVKLVPTMVFTNSNGEQIARVEGSIPKDELVSYLEQGLK